MKGKSDRNENEKQAESNGNWSNRWEESEGRVTGVKLEGEKELIYPGLGIAEKVRLDWGHELFKLRKNWLRLDNEAWLGFQIA